MLRFKLYFKKKLRKILFLYKIFLLIYKIINYPKNFQNDELNKKWKELKMIRDVCNLSIEEKRATKEIGSSLEASLKIKLDEKKQNLLNNVDLSELCITSEVFVEIIREDGIIVETKKAEGEKCPVCWKISKLPCARHKK